MPNKLPIGMAVIAILAVVQALFGALRAFDWFQIGSDLLGKGLLILPVIGLMAYVRGLTVAAIVLLYVCFALGAVFRKSWAWSLGMTAAAINALLVLSALLQGASVAQGVFWLIVPAIIFWQLLAAGGRQASEA